MAIENIKAKDVLLEKYKDIFMETIGTVPKFEFELQFTEKPKPFYRKHFRIPVKNLPETQEHVQQMLKDGVIVEGTTTYCSNAFTVPKPDGGARLVIDFSKTLNPYIARQPFPIPTIDNLLYKVKKNKIFSTIVVKIGFYHLALRKEDQNYTGFVLPFGSYYHLKMSMGICSAPEAFQQYIHTILGHLTFILICIEDVLVLSDNGDQFYAKGNQIPRIHLNLRWTFSQP